MRKAPELGLITQLLPPVANLLTPEGFGTNPHGECSGNGVGMDSALNAGVANGIQAYVPVQAPINFTGNAIGIGGSAAATSDNTFASAKMC